MSQQLFKVYLQSLQHTFKDLPKANFYWRFHKRDLNRIITVPCPVDSPSKEPEIQLFKDLRAQIGIKEEFVCPQCPHHAKCKLAFAQSDGGNMQTLLLPHMTKFLDAIGDNEINLSSKNDAKSYWLASTRVLDTFHSILIDFQLNSNKLNQQFLDDIAKASETDSTNPSLENKRSDKYTKKADFLDNDQNEDKKAVHQEYDKNEEPQLKSFDRRSPRSDRSDRNDRGNRQYRQDRSESMDKGNSRYGSSDRYDRKSRVGDRFDKTERFDRGNREFSQERGDRGNNREFREDRGNKDFRANREERGERGERGDRYPKNDRYNGGERRERGGENSFREERGGDRAQRYGQKGDRNAQSGRWDQGERTERGEGGFRGDRPERSKSEKWEKNDTGFREDRGENTERLDRSQRRERQGKVQNQHGEEEDFSSFVKQREEYLTQKDNKSEDKKERHSSDKPMEISDDTEIDVGRKVKKNMKFRVAQ